MGPVLAAIPYTTFPTIELGPLNLRTFGLMVALGVLLGAWIAAAYAERFGVSRDDTYRVGTWMVLAGIIGSRLTWAATHTDQIDSPIDVIAIWEGGIQFSGGFICALIVGLPFFRRWDKLPMAGARRLALGLHRLGSGARCIGGRGLGAPDFPRLAIDGGEVARASWATRAAGRRLPNTRLRVPTGGAVPRHGGTGVASPRGRRDRARHPVGSRPYYGCSASATAR